MKVGWWSRCRWCRSLEMTLKAFILPSLIVHPVRYFHADIGGEPASVSSSAQPSCYSRRILQWCDNERNDRYLLRPVWGEGVEPPLRILWTHASVKLSVHTNGNVYVVCIHATMRHQLNYPRLVPKPGSSPFIMGRDGYWIVPCYLLAATLMDP